MLMSNSCKAFDVKHLTSWVRNRLTKETFCIWLKGCLNLFIIPLRINEGTLNAQLLQCYTKEIIRSAIDCVRSH